MAYTKKSLSAYASAAYPELQPIREVSYQQRPQVKQSQNRKKLTRAEYLLYLSVNAALLFGVIQSVRTILHDSFTLSQLLNSQVSVQKFFSETRLENKVLKEKIQVYSSPSGIEELARNNLNMVQDNELPIRFH